jgi:hypothetical protein
MTRPTERVRETAGGPARTAFTVSSPMPVERTAGTAGIPFDRGNPARAGFQRENGIPLEASSATARRLG